MIWHLFLQIRIFFICLSNGYKQVLNLCMKSLNGLEIRMNISETRKNMIILISIHFFSAIKSITIYFSAWNTCLIYFEGKERMENFIDQGILYAY